MKRHYDEFVVSAQIAWQRHAIGLYVGFRQRDTGTFYVAKPVEFTAVDEGTAPAVPLLYLNQTEAQVLMDQLWNCGVRPTQAAGSAGSMEAQKRHLEDMRAITFGLLGDEVVKP